MDPRPLVSALALTLTACHAPLATTSHRVLDVGGFSGTWEIALVGWPGVGQESGEASPPFEDSVFGRLEIEAVDPTGDDIRGFFERIGLSPAREVEQEPERMVVRFAWTPRDSASGTEPSPAESIRFDAQLIEVEGLRFLSVQRFTGDDRLDPWSTPLQRTFLLDEPEPGQHVRLSAHPLQLLWSPIGLAGRFEFDPGVLDADGGSGLVRRFDDLLEFYAERPGSEWTPVLEARRVD